MNKQLSSYEEVMAKAYYYLAKRDYFQAELEAKLHSKGAEASLVRQAIEELAQKGYLNDTQTAEAWIRYRKAKYGPTYIKEELQAKGVAQDLAQESIAQHYDYEEEERVLESLLKYELERYQEDLPKKERERLLSRYAKRGFSLSLLLRKLNELTTNS